MCSRGVCSYTSLLPLDKERDFSNTMIGHYKLDRYGHQGSVPMLYMVDANNLVDSKHCDVGRSEGSHVEDEHYLFLFCRKDDCVSSSSDSIVNKCINPEIHELTKVSMKKMPMMI